MWTAARSFDFHEPSIPVIPRRLRLAVLHGPGSDPGTLPVGRRSRLVALAGAREGLGRCTLAANLARALTAGRRRVLLIDADTTRGNLASMLHVRPRATLAEVFAGECRFSEAVEPVGPGLDLLASPRAAGQPLRLDPFRRWRLCQALPALGFDHDFVVLNLPTGAGARVLEPAGRADEVLMVVTPDSAAMDPTAELYRGLEGLRGVPPHLVVNRVEDAGSAGMIAGRILSAHRPESTREPRLAGWIPEDSSISQLTVQHEFGGELLSNSPAACAISALARRLQITLPSGGTATAALAGALPGNVSGTRI